MRRRIHCGHMINKARPIPSTDCYMEGMVWCTGALAFENLFCVVQVCAGRFVQAADAGLFACCYAGGGMRAKSGRGRGC